jgi:tellurite resistance protein
MQMATTTVEIAAFDQRISEQVLRTYAARISAQREVGLRELAELVARLKGVLGAAQVLLRLRAAGRGRLARGRGRTRRPALRTRGR